jgi:hypothetical protein
MAREFGVSKATVQRVWSQNEIKPHLTRVFKLSSDPDFEAKFWDVIGLYLNPPEQAVVLCEVFNVFKEHRFPFRSDNFRVTTPFPPTHLDTEQFNFIVGYSVFSHLSEDACAGWMKEFNRLLVPGGSLH